MIIVSNFSILASICFIGTLGIGAAILGYVLALFVKRFQDPEDEEDQHPVEYEPYVASDGKTYWWPKKHKRSSRKNDTEKTA